MISQYWFRKWLGAVRQQTITWANVDLIPCRHMTSPGHNELKLVHRDSNHSNGWHVLFDGFVHRYSPIDALKFLSTPFHLRGHNNLWGLEVWRRVKRDRNSLITLFCWIAFLHCRKGTNANKEKVICEVVIGTNRFPLKYGCTQIRYDIMIYWRI